MKMASAGAIALALIAALSLASVRAAGTQPKEESEDSRPNAFSKLIEKFRLPDEGTETDTVLRIGDQLPALECKDIDGRSLDIDSLCGDNATLFVCWSTGCGAALAELPHEKKLGVAYKNRGLRIIGINDDSHPARAKAAMEILGIKWPTIYEPKTLRTPKGAFQTLKIETQPVLLLFDGQKRLVAASPSLRTRRFFANKERDTIGVAGIECALTKLLGAFENSTPIMSPFD